MAHFPITQASLLAAVTWIVGQLVAFVPSLGPDKQALISIGTTVVTLGFLIANAIHAHAAAQKAAGVSKTVSSSTSRSGSTNVRKK